MSVIYFLIGIGILVAGGFLFAFIWAVKSGQYEDDYTPSVRVLFDDIKPTSESSEQPETESTNNKKEKTDNNINI